MDPRIWQKIVGLSGVAALGLGTYGAHGFKPKNPSYKEFGGLLTTGILAFSGTIRSREEDFAFLIVFLPDKHSTHCYPVCTTLGQPSSTSIEVLDKKNHLKGIFGPQTLQNVGFCDYLVFDLEPVNQIDISELLALTFSIGDAEDVPTSEVDDTEVLEDCEKASSSVIEVISKSSLSLSRDVAFDKPTLFDEIELP
ncbi:hypothetical protein ACS0TY_023901 [Phlomoides rotata]